LGLSLALRAAAADDISLSPRRGVLLLNNGQLIAGLITAAGDRYDVTLDGGELHVPRTHVAVLAADAAECYVYKRSLVETGRIQDHLELAEWCLRNGLAEQSQREIAAARALDPTHPKLRLLESRLELAAEGAPRQPSEPIKTPEKSTGADQLDAMARNLPHGVMESFTNNIQPILLNYCSRSGCHGTQGETALRLERIPPNRRAGRKPTQRNLQAALAMIDRANPDQSRLLTAPLEAHGGMKAPVFGEREQAQYKQLVQWVFQVAGPKAAAPPSLSERGSPLLQARAQPPAEVAMPPASRTAPTVSPPETTTEGTAVEAQPTVDSGEQFRVTRIHGQLELRPMAKTSPDAQPFVPKDVFDPAIFNRRFFGE
jgi:hypothetical protein